MTFESQVNCWHSPLSHQEEGQDVLPRRHSLFGPAASWLALEVKRGALRGGGWVCTPAQGSAFSWMPHQFGKPVPGPEVLEDRLADGIVVPGEMISKKKNTIPPWKDKMEVIRKKL